MNKQMEHERNNTNISRHTYIYMHTYIHTHKHTRMPACSHIREQVAGGSWEPSNQCPPFWCLHGGDSWLQTCLCRHHFAHKPYLCWGCFVICSTGALRTDGVPQRTTQHACYQHVSVCVYIYMYIRITIQTGAYVCIFICNHEAILQVLLRKLKRQNNKNTSNWIMQHK